MQQDNTSQSFYTSDIWTNMIVGISDGLSIPFIIVTAFSNVVVNNEVVIWIGAIAAGMGAIAMGVGNYLSNKEQLEEQLGILDEREIEIMISSGITKEIIEKMELHALSNKEKWEVLVDEYGLGLAKPDVKRIKQTAVSVGCFYCLAGLISIIPYYFTATTSEGRLWSVIITLSLLGLFGVVKAKLTGLSIVKEPARLLVITSTAAACLYYVTGLF
ncbi:MAG: VIT1/CCC1 transporter family protein [Flavipsychrobacter sp.]